MSNKSNGNKFEADLSRILNNNGFWVHRLAPNSFGQPADLIAVRNAVAYLIDAKDCSTGRFVLSRIEENQEYAMRMWRSKGNGCGWFALQVEDGIYMFTLKDLLMYREVQKSLSLNDIKGYGIPLERWMRNCD